MLKFYYITLISNTLNAVIQYFKHIFLVKLIFFHHLRFLHP